MAFKVLEMAIALAGQLRGPLEAVRRRDRSLEDQLRRAATSVVLNFGRVVGSRWRRPGALHPHRCWQPV